MRHTLLDLGGLRSAILALIPIGVRLLAILLANCDFNFMSSKLSLSVMLLRINLLPLNAFHQMDDFEFQDPKSSHFN